MSYDDHYLVGHRLLPWPFYVPATLAIYAVGLGLPLFALVTVLVWLFGG